MKIRKIIYYSAISLALTVLIISAVFQPVIRISENADNIQTDYEPGSVIEPFKDLRITKIIIIFDKSDFISMRSGVPKTKCLETSDKAVIEEFKNMKFAYTGGDIATVGGKIYIYDGKNLVFESGIFLDNESEGLQSYSFGFIEPLTHLALSDVCKKFKKCGNIIIMI